MFATRVGLYKQPAPTAPKTYVAVATTGKIYKSDDAVTWTNIRNVAGEDYYGVVKLGNNWIICGRNTSTNTPIILNSSDLSTFNSVSIPSGSWTNWRAYAIATSGSDVSIVVNDQLGQSNYYMWYSSDGSTWNSNPNLYNTGGAAARPLRPKQYYYDNQYVVAGRNNSNACIWTASSASANRTLVTIASVGGKTMWSNVANKFTNSLYAANVASTSADEPFYYSSTGTSWTAGTTNIFFTAYALAYGNNIGVTVGTDGNIRTSTDGSTWTSRTSGTAQSIFDVIYDGTKFIAVGITGYVATSTNGITWTNTPITGNPPLQSICYA